jgi:hypothetical protein
VPLESLGTEFAGVGIPFDMGFLVRLEGSIVAIRPERAGRVWVLDSVLMRVGGRHELGEEIIRVETKL